MSLENAVIENTAAIRDLIATIRAGVPTTAAQVAAVVTEAQAVTTAAVAAKAEAEPEVVTQMNASEAAEALHGQANKPATPTYQDTAAAVQALAKSKGRDAAVAVLKKFGAAKLPEVKPEQFADVIAECATAGA